MWDANKRLVASGLAGVVLALVIIASVDMMFWYRPPKVLLGVSVGEDELLRLEGPKGVVYQQPPFFRFPPCILNVTIYEFTKPAGPGSEADIVVTLTSKLNVSITYNVEAHITNTADVNPGGTVNGYSWFYRDWFSGGGIGFVDGGIEWAWTGKVDANGSKTLNFRLKATGVGTAMLRVKAESDFIDVDPAIRVIARQSVEISFTVLPNNILVFSAWPRPEPYLFLESIDIGIDSPRPWGVGSEFNVSVLLFGDNATNVTLKLIMQEGIILVEGQTAWTGNMTSYDEVVGAYCVRLSARIRFIKAGGWFIYSQVEKDGILFNSPEAIKFMVSTDNIEWHHV